MTSDGVANFGCRFNGGVSKPAMMDLRQWHGVNIGVLADSADVDPAVIYCMLLSRPVERVKAVGVVDGLSKLVGVNYGLEDIEVVLSNE